MSDEPQYCDVCCLQICAGRCGCSDWVQNPDGVYTRTSKPPEVLVRMRGNKPPATPDVMLGRVMRLMAWCQRE